MTTLTSVLTCRPSTSNRKMASPKKSTCKAIHLVGYGGYDKLKVVEIAMPKAGNGEVLVNIRAAGINFAELMRRQGVYDQWYGRSNNLPVVLGAEGSGEVVQAGDGCSRVKVSIQRLVL